MSPRLLRRVPLAWSLALAALAAGCGGKPAVTDTAEVVTQTPPPGSAPAPAAEPAPTSTPAEAPAPAPAEAKP